MAQLDRSPEPEPGAADTSGVTAQSSDGAGEGAELRGRAVRGFAWAAVSFGGNKLLVFVSTLVLTRLLAPSDFGVVAAGLTFIAYLEVALDLGVGSAIVYQQEKGHSRGVHVAFTMNVLACAALAALNFALAPVVAEFFRVPGAADVFRAFSIYILLRGLGALQDSLLRRDLLFREKAAADLTRALLRGGLGVVLALAGLGVWSLVWAFLVAEAAGTGVAWFKTRYRPRLMFDRVAAGPLLRFGAPVVALNLLSELGTNSDYLVVGHVLGATALGIYTIAYRLPELLLSNVYWIFSSVAFPVFSRARSDSWAMFRDSMLRALRLITLFGFPVSVGLALVSRDAVTVLFSDKWAAAGGPMTLISLAIGLGAIGYGSGDIYKAAGRPGMLLVINTVGAFVLLPCFVLAAPHGLVAVAAVHLSYNAVYGVVRLVFANRLVGTTMADVLVALRPALCLSAGIAVVALPVRLLMPSGPVALCAIIAAGLAGAGLGLLLVGRSVLDDLRGLAGELGGRAGS